MNPATKKEKTKSKVEKNISYTKLETPLKIKIKVFNRKKKTFFYLFLTSCSKLQLAHGKRGG